MYMSPLMALGQEIRKVYWVYSTDFELMRGARVKVQTTEITLTGSVDVGSMVTFGRTTNGETFWSAGRPSMLTCDTASWTLIQ